jgi:hypothetical protein
VEKDRVDVDDAVALHSCFAHANVDDEHANDGGISNACYVMKETQ